MDMKILRDEIDSIDKELLTLFEKRMEICRQVGEYKKLNDLPVYDLVREKQLLKDKVYSLNDKTLTNSAICFFQSVMDISKEEQQKICKKTVSNQNMVATKVAYQGVLGAYSHEAATGYFNELTDFYSYNTFEDVVVAVLDGVCQFGILPIENSCGGSVLSVYDLLGKYNTCVVGETVLPIDHCLLGLKKDSIETVYSHPQALSQCSTFIGINDFTPVPVANTAMAAKMVGENGEITAGAIASAYCGEKYGLQVLARDIANVKNNFTRFVIISKEESCLETFNKVSINFSLKHEKHALLNVLEHFSNMNMTKIESRPKGEFEYDFYLDFQGELSKTQMENLLENLKQCTNTVKLLGAYNME